MAFCPSAVHTVKHAGPVHCLRAARTSVQRENGAVAVIFSCQQRLDAHVFKLLLESIEHLLCLFGKGGIPLLIAHLNHGCDIIIVLLQAVVLGDRILQVLEFLHLPVRLVCIIPEVRFLHDMSEFFYP